MRFKEWIIIESGHFRLSEPQDLYVMFKGKPEFARDIDMIDPRFEFMDMKIKDNTGESKKFLGQSTFSLPLVNQQGSIERWIVVPRDDKKMQMLGGGEPAFLSSYPKGIKAPINWAEYAQLINLKGSLANLVNQS